MWSSILLQLLTVPESSLGWRFKAWEEKAEVYCHITISIVDFCHFSVILRPWVLVRPRESNRRPLALHSHALPTELTLPRLKLAWENSRLSRRQFCFPHKMTSEKRAQKFHTGYLLLARSGNASDLLKQICLTARPIRSNTQITTHNPLNHSNEGLALEMSSSQLKFTLMTYRRTIHSIGWLGGRYVNTVFGKGHVLSSSGIG